MGTICEKELDKSMIHKWKIKILKTKFKNIMIGIATSDFDINSSIYSTCGWYFNFYNSKILSGPPNNYDIEIKLKPKDEITVVVDMEQKILKFLIENEKKSAEIKDIPLDKPIFFFFFLYNKNDSIEIEEC